MAHLVENLTSSGPTYTLRWRDVTGTHRQRTYRSRRTAQRELARVATAVADGQSTQHYRKTTRTVADAVEEVLGAHRARGLKPSTLLGYEQVYNARILPMWGARRLNSLTAGEIEAWARDLLNPPTPASRGLTLSTVHKAVGALNQACRMAIRRGWLATNPCAGLDLPSPTAAGVVPFQAVFLTPAQVESLATALADQPPYDLIIRVAAYTGLRAGEIAGLQVRDINLLQKTITVARTAARIKGEWVIGTPKSIRSRRTVPILHAPLVEDLRVWLGGHPRRNDPTAPLWPGRSVGTGLPDWDRPYDPGVLYRRHYKPALVTAGLPTETRFHDLRHTFASMLLAAGVEPLKVSRWSGHASLATTDKIYSHLYPSDHSKEAAAFAAYVATAAPEAATVTPLTRAATP
ncbi:tyrosine-type recombinase/integrase [Allobranchiibius sp. GilTou73]|uniref:tyrosine-type recombinase/integrase n=1 Tax=Allobranchiibius sp. GilTou73 TaxID=2904523 RepID=UPI001F3554CF|nr:tyrosine-type recombinase/integrase [Allobranchiibius sp. GilTou73]UIJ33371.1 site-specific integrase [Allobranchiibius sp. GilTou73]